MKIYSEDNDRRGSDGDGHNDATHAADCCWNEKVKAAVGLDNMLVNLEVEFRKDLDPRNILTKVMRLTCEFYGGDWCGALDIKADVNT